jgi:hypothetical protein
MSKAFTWKVQLLYLFCAFVLGVITWTFTIDITYGELITSPRIQGFATLMIGSVIFFTFLATLKAPSDAKWAAHAATIFVMFVSLLLPYVVAIGESGIYARARVGFSHARDVAKTYSCPITWEGSKATLACEYGKAELTVPTIPIAYHMRPLPNKAICQFKKFATGKFEDCKIF